MLKQKPRFSGVFVMQSTVSGVQQIAADILATAAQQAD
jgi:hypothetical protein